MEKGSLAVGYLCPRCGQRAVGLRSLRDLEGGPAQVPCRCGGSALQSRPEGETLHLSVPCGACGGVHPAAVPRRRLPAGDTALQCPQTRQLCCFLGRETVVQRQLEEMETVKAKEQGQDPRAPFTDSVIMYEVLSELRDIAARPRGILCLCGSSRYGIEVRRRSVELVCRTCGARLRLGAATDRDLDALCSQVYLRIPGSPPPEAPGSAEKPEAPGSAETPDLEAPAP